MSYSIFLLSVSYHSSIQQSLIECLLCQGLFKGLEKNAWETPMKKQIHIVGGAYIFNCYFLRLGSWSNIIGFGTEWVNILSGPKEHGQKSISQCSRVCRPDSNNQGYLIMQWAEAQEQKALGKVNKSGSISISVAPRRTTEVQQSPTPSKKRAW